MSKILEFRLYISLNWLMRNTNIYAIWTCSHYMAILKSQNKNTDLLMILALLCRFNYIAHKNHIKNKTHSQSFHNRLFTDIHSETH